MILAELPCASTKRATADMYAYYWRKKTKRLWICTRVVRADGTPVYRIVLDETIVQHPSQET
jgi:hypothetical protein